jgi:hypothetical protein
LHLLKSAIDLSLILVTLILGVLSYRIFNFEHQAQWSLFSVFAAYLFSRQIVAPRVGVIAATFFFYLLMSGIFTWLWKYNRFLTVDVYDQQAIRFYAADSVGKLLLIVTPILLLNLRRSHLSNFGGAFFAFLCFFNAFMLVLQFVRTDSHCELENSCHGLIGNSSMNVTVMISMLPFVFKHYWSWAKYLTLILVVVGTIVSKTSIGVGTLAATAVIYMVLYRRWILLSAVPVLGFVGIKHLGATFLNSGNRFEMWEFFMRKWDVPANHWFGLGFGTFGIFSRHLQKAFNNRPKDQWVWMHNDWLQFPFELGIIGFVLAIAVYLASVYGFYRRGEKHDLAALVLFGTGMFFNYPLHIPLACAFGAWLVYSALYKEDAPYYNLGQS